LLKTKIPEDLANFYLASNGGFPQNFSWMEDGEEAVRVQCLLPMKQRTKYANTIEATYQTGLKEGYLVEGLIPFARDFGGNYVCFDQNGGIVFYSMDTWSRETDDETNKRKALHPITNSFQSFLDGLQPEPEY
jgi:hypothetical protein